MRGRLAWIVLVGIGMGVSGVNAAGLGSGTVQVTATITPQCTFGASPFDAAKGVDFTTDQ